MADDDRPQIEYQPPGGTTEFDREAPPLEIDDPSRTFASKLTREVWTELIDCAMRGVPDTIAAECARIAPSTLARWLEFAAVLKADKVPAGLEFDRAADETVVMAFADEYRRARAWWRKQKVVMLDEASKVDPAMAAWLLERREPRYYARPAIRAASDQDEAQEFVMRVEEIAPKHKPPAVGGPAPPEHANGNGEAIAEPAKVVDDDDDSDLAEPE